MMELEHKSATTSVLNNLSHCFDICGQRPLNFQDGEKYHGSGAAFSRLPPSRKMNQGHPTDSRLKTPYQLFLS